MSTNINRAKDAGNRTLTPQALAARWNASASHLANWRRAGTGPSYMKPAGRLRY